MTPTPVLLALCTLEEGRLRPRRAYIETGRAVVGALLFELALAGRLELTMDHVLVRRTGSTGDPVQDELLDHLAGAARERPPREWVESLGPWGLGQLGRLVPGAGESGAAEEARSRVRQALHPPNARDLRALAVAALLIAARQGHLVWPALARKERARRMALAMGLLELGSPDSGAALDVVSASVNRSIAASAAALVFPG